ncbi:MAG: hypothetical protein WAO20_18755 [Acidobacteriota bacterium]
MKRLAFWSTLIVLGWMFQAPPLAAANQDTYREAYDAGFQDGSAVGAQHRDHHRAFDFANDPAYIEALHGFDAKNHDREVYRVAYRRGFEDGYEEGYGLGAGPVSSNGPGSPAPANSDARALAGRYVIPEGTEIRIRLLDSLATQRNEAGDPFRAETVGDVIIDNEVAVPSGSKIYGEVALVKRAGRIRGRSEITLKFREIELSEGHRFSFDATVVSIEEQRKEEVEDGEGTIKASSGTGGDVKKVGAATGIGALIGILTGGGAKVGAAIGAIAGTAGVLAIRGSDLVLPVETELVVRLDRDLTVRSGLLRAR